MTTTTTKSRALMYDVCYPKTVKNKEGKEEVYWIKVGVAWPQTSGKVKIRMDSLPLGMFLSPEFDLVLFPHGTDRKEKDSK